MFSAMCECQALHPDPDDSDSDNDFEGEEYDVEEAGEEKSIESWFTEHKADVLNVLEISTFSTFSMSLKVNISPLMKVFIWMLYEQNCRYYVEKIID